MKKVGHNATDEAGNYNLRSTHVLVVIYERIALQGHHPAEMNPGFARIAGRIREAFWGNSAGFEVPL